MGSYVNKAKVLVLLLIVAFLSITPMTNRGFAQYLVRGDPRIIGNTGLTTESGYRVRLSDFRGKVVFINFWGSWCPPCIDEMASIRALQGLLKNYRDDIAFVFISARQQTFDRDSEWLRRNVIAGQNYQWEPRIPEQRLAFFGALPETSSFAVPTTYVLDRDGGVAGFHTAPIDWKTHLAQFLELLSRPSSRSYLY
jgi:thiol-disulfide isomerase/thioredoxin